MNSRLLSWMVFASVAFPIGAQNQPIISAISSVFSTKLNISRVCSSQLEKYVEKLQNISQTSWALEMLDATSKIPTGLLQLNLGEMGNFHQCLNVNSGQETNPVIYGKYCLGYLMFNPSSTNISKIIQALQSSTTPNPTWAICLPNGCTTEDTNLIGNTILGYLPIELDLSIGFSDDACQTIQDVELDLSPAAIGTIVFLAVLVAIVLLSTIVNVYQVELKLKSDIPMIITGFSLYSNAGKIFKLRKYTSDQISCLDGIKFYSMIWVVIGHQFSVSMIGAISNGVDLLKWADSWRSMFLVSATLSVDTFLMVTGALLTVTFLTSRRKNRPFNLFLFYLHRYIRLTPPLAVVILISATLITYLGSGPRWASAYKSFQQPCEQNWWVALLYVQNYVNVTNMCVGQTWYLSVDMQLYLISPVILFLLYKKPTLALAILSFIILMLFGVIFYVAWQFNLVGILSNLHGVKYDYDNNYYLLTHTRAAPWLIGAILGYFIFEAKQSPKKRNFNQVFIVGTWIISLSTLLACIFGGHSTLRGQDYDKWGNVLYITFTRPGWSTALAVIVYLCATNRGGPINWFLSLPIYQIFNKFTYSIYLTHVTYLYLRGFAQKTPKTFDEFQLALDFWGTLMLNVGLSALLVFMVESPMITIEKIIFGNFGRRNSWRPNDPENGVVNKGFEQ